MASGAVDIVTYLQSQAIGTAGTNLFIGKTPDNTGVQDLIAALIDTAPIYISPKWLRDERTFQVLVRSDINDYASGYNFAESIMNALLGIDPFTSSDSKRYYQFTILSGITSLGQDPKERWIFSINFQYVVELPSGGVRSTF